MARILWVDGHHAGWADVLRADGHDVQQVATAREALDRLGQAAVQLVVCRGPDAVPLVERLRVEHRETAVVVITPPTEAALPGCGRITSPIAEQPLREAVWCAVERYHLRIRAESQREDAPTLTWGAASMRPVVESLGRLATTEATVLLQGERGSGRTTAARALHAWSLRADAPFLVVRCAGRRAADVAAELFGHGSTRGRLEQAAEGTLYLDGVDELGPELQVRLLATVQDGRFQREGATWAIEATARIVVSTTRPLSDLVRTGQFREDLAYRLSVFPVAVPPLRDRTADIAPLARELLTRSAHRLGRAAPALDAGAEAALQARSWPGNAHELANALERALLFTDGSTLSATWLVEPAPRMPPAMPAPRTLEQVERDAVAGALAHVNGNRRKAAEILGIGERTLYDKIRRYNLG